MISILPRIARHPFSRPIAIGFSVFLFTALCSGKTNADEKWKWSDDRASILHYFMGASTNFEVKLVRRSMASWREVTVEVGNGSEVLHKISTHAEGNFVIAGSLVIYTKHSMIGSGCELLAFDLDKQKYAWRTQLKGIGPVDHSKYRNRVNLEVRKNSVAVYGFESAGQYVEVVDLKTGDTLSNTVGSGQYKRFKESKK